MKLAVVGATGEVGRTMIRVLEEQGVRPDSIRFFASSRSAGGSLQFAGHDFEIEELTPSAIRKGAFDYVLMSAGGAVSRRFAPIAVSAGAVVIDNSSAWRMSSSALLVVPEINGRLLRGYKGIIANPNCSTIQMVLSMNKLYEKWGIRSICVSTYQSVSGAGHRGICELEAQEKGSHEVNVFQTRIFRNVIPQIGDICENDFSEEEMKMVNEPRKIFGDPRIVCYPTTVRVPTLYSHCESILVETRSPFASLDEVREVLASQEHVTLCDDPVITSRDAEGSDQTYVGRVRSFDDTHVLYWNAADNVRVGAATNAVRILMRHMELNS